MWPNKWYIKHHQTAVPLCAMKNPAMSQFLVQNIAVWYKSWTTKSTNGLLISLSNKAVAFRRVLAGWRFKLAHFSFFDHDASKDLTINWITNCSNIFIYVNVRANRSVQHYHVKALSLNIQKCAWHNSVTFHVNIYIYIIVCHPKEPVFLMDVLFHLMISSNWNINFYPF